MKVLVIYTTAGAGHRKAAEAVHQALKNSSQGEAILVDSLDHTSPHFKRLYSGVYTFLITEIPTLWGFIFWLIDIPFLRPLVLAFRRLYNSLNAGPLHRYLEKENFDYIISTHFMLNEISAALKRKGKIRSTIISVITDYDVHSIWVAPGIDYYTVASEWTKRKLTTLGIAAEKITVTGIPTHEKFSQPKNITELRSRFGLKNGMFTVLIATGSFGIGPIEEIIRVLKDFQVIVICGHNKKLYERLSKEAGDDVKVFGLVNNMDELMAIADAMITKPGGLSISEALVMGLPMIFFNAIPGQETNNIKVLKTYGVGLSDCPISQMPVELKRLQSSPAELNEMKKKIRALARPNAAKDIGGLILK